MIVLVCGQRDFEDYNFLEEKLDALHHSYWNITKLIEGGAPGADRLAGAWAMNNCVELKVYPADWKKYGRAAGPIRNRQMYDETKPDLVVAFYHDKETSKGTKDMVTYAESKGTKVFEFVKGPNDTCSMKWWFFS